MAEDQASSAAPQEDAASTAVANPAEGQEPEVWDTAYVQKLRSENAAWRVRAAEAEKYRTQAKELAAKVKQHEDAQLSETERLQKRLAELEDERTSYQRDRQERTLRYEVQLAAAGRFHDPADALAHLDLNAVEFDEDGSPTNLPALLDDLLGRKPYLARSADAAPVAAPRVGATNPGRSPSAQGTFTRSQIADRSFWNANKDAILRAMSDGRITDD